MVYTQDFQLKIVYCQHFLLFKGIGVRNGYDDLIKSANLIIKGLQENTNYQRVLVDLSEVITVTSNADLFNLVRFYESKRNLLNRFSIALVINEDEIESSNFLDSLFFNRNLPFKTFININAAENWLKGEDKI